MNELFNPIFNIFDNSTGFQKIQLIIVLGLLILFFIYLIWKLTFFRSLPEDNNVKEKKNRNTKVEMSKFSYVWLTIVFPVIVLIYIFFIA